MPECALWWCEATYKVGRERPVPTNSSPGISIAAARNEFEPFQLVFRPATPLTNVSVALSDLVYADGPGVSPIAATNIEVLWVDYVPVVTPSEPGGVPGPYPDPLPPLSQPFALTNTENQPLWFTVYVSRDAPAGRYEGTVTVETELGRCTMPLQLRVFNFGLPDVTHTRTAYGVTLDNYWHALETAADFDTVWDLYMQNLRRHRISPYMPHARAPIRWQMLAGGGGLYHDFTAFTAAMSRYLDEFNFNSFKLLDEPWTLNDYPRFSPEFNRLFAQLLGPMLTYLHERGWADKAYTYWIDEPDLNQPDVVALVQDGMRAHLEAVPDLRRLLTYAPDARLHNLVDIWVPMVGESVFQPAAVAERLALGEEVWWYVCTYPKAPLPNNFIDHPALAPRIRAWLAEKYGLTGELYWNVAYYRNRDDGQPVNPWQQTTLYTPTGESVGNGDGVLLYPPVRTPPGTPVVAGPINSLRWELLREGLEDREYFWLLRQVLADAELRLGPGHPAVQAGQAAREAALALVPSLTVYAQDPQAVYAAREQLAAAIEALDDGAPRFVRQPVSQAVDWGDTAVLRAEALGWPPPAYQWRLGGTNLPGATSSWLGLTNIGPAHLGTYTVLASNAAGVTISAEARLVGDSEPVPGFVSHPVSQARSAGGNAVFVGTAVSGSWQSYQWLWNGVPLETPPATNAVLLLTNLTAAQAGDYSLVVSNAYGVVTSAPARLVVVSPPTTNLLAALGGPWRYHDAGVDLGTAWRNPDFDDSAWSEGDAPLGYGEDPIDLATLLADGATPKPATVYFRRWVSVPAHLATDLLMLRLRADDGAVVYLNGAEVCRLNMPEGPVAHETAAVGVVEGPDELRFVSIGISADGLSPGTNLLAVELHQCAGNIAPLAFWTLDESSPPWRDELGGHDFQAVGTNVGAGPGKVEGAVTNGSSATSWLETADAPALRYSGPFTVGGWFVFHQASGDDPATTCLEKADEFRLYYTGTAINRYRFRVGNTEIQDRTSGTKSGQWRFVVGWFDGTNLCIQVDNGPVYSTNAQPPAPSTNPVVALKRTREPGGFAADEVFFYKRALTTGERANLYNLGPRAVIQTSVDDLVFDLDLSSVRFPRPEFVESPTSLVRRAGESAGFRLTASSSIQPAYQWQFNGAPIAGATDPLLFLPAVTPAQAGLYALVASNAGGAVTSAPARLTVVVPPMLVARAVGGGGSGWALALPASEVASTLLASSNLVDWEEVLKRPAGAAATNWPVWPEPGLPQRYYRLRLEW